MKKNLKVWLLLVVSAAAAILAAAWAVETFYSSITIIKVSPFSSQYSGTIPPPASFIEGIGEIEFNFIAKTVISTINIAILIFLTLTYANIYRKTRSEFTVGLLIFAVLFLIKDVSSSPLMANSFGVRMWTFGLYTLLPDLLEFIALSVLLYLSIE